MLRSLAGAVVLLWVAAQILCTDHCALDGSHGNGESASCHGPTPAHSHEDGDSSGPTHDDSGASVACDVLKCALSSGNEFTLFHPGVHPLYTLASLKLPSEATLNESATPIFRQACLGDWVFTPEVCLGPAFRSHAPPVSSAT